MLVLDLIPESFYQQELDYLLERIEDEETRTFVLQMKDTEV